MTDGSDDCVYILGCNAFISWVSMFAKSLSSSACTHAWLQCLGYHMTDPQEWYSHSSGTVLDIELRASCLKDRNSPLSHSQGPWKSTPLVFIIQVTGLSLCI